MKGKVMGGGACRSGGTFNTNKLLAPQSGELPAYLIQEKANGKWKIRKGEG